MLRVLPASRATTRSRWFASCLILVLLASVLAALPGTAESHPPEISLAASSTHKQVHPGGQASFLLTITNDADEEENVTLDETSAEEVRISFLEGRTWSVPGNASLEVELLARVDSGASQGARDVQVDAFVGNQSQANLTLTVQVVFPPAQIALSPSPWELDAAPGQEVQFILTVHNHGEREDRVALRADGPQNVSVTFPGGDARTVPAGESRDVHMRAYVDESVQEGQRSIEVRALARGETQATVNLGLNVVKNGQGEPGEGPEETPGETTEQEAAANETANETTPSLVRMSVAQDEARVAPGGKTTFRVTLTNDADVHHSVELRRNSDPHVSIRMIGGVHREVPVGGTDTVDIEVSVSRDADPGARTLIIYAIGTNGTLDHLRLTVNVDPTVAEAAETGPSQVETPGPPLVLVVVLTFVAVRWFSKRRRF